MSELLFLQALRDVGADESKWRDSRYAVYYVAASVSDDIEVSAFVDGAVAIETDTDGIQVRDSGDLTEAVRFAENLRRVLAGEPSLEVERLQKALDQALFFAEIRPIEFDDDTLYARSTFDQNPVLFRDRFPELAAELKRRVEEVQG